VVDASGAAATGGTPLPECDDPSEVMSLFCCRLQLAHIGTYGRMKMETEPPILQDMGGRSNCSAIGPRRTVPCQFDDARAVDVSYGPITSTVVAIRSSSEMRA
jgi:hypothetical protein